MILQGFVFKDLFGHTHYVKDFLAAGGQGAIYTTEDYGLLIKVTVDDDEKPLKVSREEYDKYLEKLEYVRSFNSFGLDQMYFAMPIVALEFPYTGYIMKRVMDTKLIIKFLSSSKSDEITRSLQYRYDIAVEITKALNKLHNNQIVYCDINNKNIMISINENYKNVVFIDMDNIMFSSDNAKIVYTPAYKAPEVTEVGNSIFSDVYSYAFLVFQLITKLLSPLVKTDGESNNWYDDIEEDNEIYEFKYSQTDDQNYKQYLESILSIDMLKLFNSTFTINNTKDTYTRRPRLHFWYDQLRQSSNHIVSCRCNYEFFYKNDNICPNCGEVVDYIKLSLYRSVRDDRVTYPVNNLHMTNYHSVFERNLIINKTEKIMINNNHLDVASLNEYTKEIVSIEYGKELVFLRFTDDYTISIKSTEGTKILVKERRIDISNFVNLSITKNNEIVSILEIEGV